MRLFDFLIYYKSVCIYESPYFCQISQEFKDMWVKHSDKCKEKSKVFLKENNIHTEIGAFVLFLHEDHRIRIDFLEWAIANGYETIKDLFV